MDTVVRPLMIALLLLVGWLALPSGAQAQELQPAWLENLECPDDLQVYQGIAYCRSKDSPLDVYVIVIDLFDPGPRLEYIIATGIDMYGSEEAECRDVNIPSVSTGPGCRDPLDASLYPVMTLAQAAERASSLDAALVVNGDYSACTTSRTSCENSGVDYRGHGPEGLTVVHGERLDGINVNDTDNNAVNRPWLAAAEKYAFQDDLNAEKLRVEISQLTGTDPGISPENWIWTGMGGAPWLIKDGDVVEWEIAACYQAAGSCYDGASQTAAGLSEDGRWLFLVLGVKPPTLLDLANFMQAELEIHQAIKLDGGGSTQLWYTGAEDPYILRGDGRPLTNYLAVIAPPGNGIILEPEPEPEPEPGPDGSWWDQLWAGVAAWWDEVTAGIEQRLNTWWAEQQQKLEEWWQEQQRRALEELERQLVEWFNGLCGAAFLPGTAALVLTWNLRRRRRSEGH
jgi:hypothetical protein